jgi:DNA-directed RNA polymerase subunit H
MRWSRVRIIISKVSSGPPFKTRKVIIIAKEKEFEISQHVLVPKHTKLSEKETQELLAKYNISVKQLPSISAKDPAIAGLDVGVGDIVKIQRFSPTSKITVFYRKVVK